MRPAKTRPLSIRLPARAIERLRERADRVRGRPTAVAREQIVAVTINGSPVDALDPDTLTPREALDKLYELKKL